MNVHFIKKCFFLKKIWSVQKKAVPLHAFLHEIINHAHEMGHKMT